MKKPQGNEVLSQRHVRFFAQPGGPHPENPVRYSGVAYDYMNIESVDSPIRGGINAINVHDPSKTGAYRQIASSFDAPDIATATVMFYQKLDSLPSHLVDGLDCETNYYQVVGSCKDPSDFLSGWSAYVKIFSKGIPSSLTEAGGGWDSDDALEDEIEYSFNGGIVNIGKLAFGEKAAAQVYSEIKDVVYGSRVQCGSCGPSDDGTKLIYAVANNTVASAGQAPSVFYSTNGGTTWTEAALTGSASTDVPTAIDIVGQYLVVTYTNATTGGYWYSELNSITGAPNATWTSVTTGFVSGSGPNDIWVDSASAIWFCGDGGYIYKADSIQSGVSAKEAGSATTENLNRIQVLGDIVLAVGENGKSVASLNGGNTFSVSAADPSADGIDALSIAGPFLWWVGTDAGGLFYSTDQGVSWTAKVIPTSVATIQDIVHITPEVMFVLTATSGPAATIYTSWNGGYTFSSGDPRMLNWPTIDRANRLAFPDVSRLGVAVNNVVVGGLAGNGTDGILLVASKV